MPGAEQQANRRVLHFYGPVFVVEMALFLVWHPGSWHPAELAFAVIVLFGLSSIRCVQFGAVRVEPGAPVLALGATLLTPLTTIALGLIGAYEAGVRRRRWADALVDFVSITTYGIGAGAVFWFGESQG